MCLLKKNVSIKWKKCLLIENVPINWKCAHWKIKSHNCSVFLNVYFALVYIAMWYNKKQSTKS